VTPSHEQGADLFAHSCAGCHGSDGGGGEHGPNIATAPQVIGLADAQLSEILKKGIPSGGMPAFAYLEPDKLQSLVGYLRVLQGISGLGEIQLPGDPHNGDQLFFGSAACANCHMIHGRGGFMGADLTEYARGRSADAVRGAIVRPTDNAEGLGHLVEIETRGKRTKGLIRARDNYTIVLQSEDGAFHSIARDQILKMVISRGTLMPQDYSHRLDDKQIDDLVSYLLRTAGSGRPAQAQTDSEH
jgi:cytochrome c oxidase cbb3-type subunit 3